MACDRTEARTAQLNNACSTAEQFIDLYYDRLDSKRHTLSKLYLENATMSWNGNAITGHASVQQFYLDKVPTSQHEITSFDAQPVLDSAVNGQTTVAVMVAGAVRYQDKRTKPFQQSFLLTAQGDKWKVATDTFRYQEPSAVSANS